MGNKINTSHQSADHVFSEAMSLQQVSTLTHVYRDFFQKQLDQPSAEHNHIYNFHMKLSNFVSMHHIIHSISSGALTMLVKSTVGERFERISVNYLGHKRAKIANIFMYMGVFFYLQTWFYSWERLNINYLVNVRDFNG